MISEAFNDSLISQTLRTVILASICKQTLTFSMQDDLLKFHEKNFPFVMRIDQPVSMKKDPSS